MDGVEGLDRAPQANGAAPAASAAEPTTVTRAGLSWLHEHHPGPFVRNRLTEANVRSVWRLRESVVVEQSHDRYGDPVVAPVLVALGEPDDVAMLLREFGARLPRPGFVTVEARAYTGLPRGWRYEQANRWDAMWTDTPPAPVPGEDDVVAVDDDEEVRRLLEVANPGSHGQPGDPRIRAWLGIRERGELVAAGALAEAAQSGVAHVRGVSTHPGRRDRGLGTAVSAALTRLGLDSVSPLVTLGVYSWNAAAISVYQRLGYRHDRSFVSGPLEP